MNLQRSSSSGRAPRRGAARVLLAIAGVVLAVFAGRVVVNRLSVRTALAEGEDAFRRGDFGQAAAKFKFAVDLDPASTALRLRLVAAYQKQFVPGGESRANLDIATQTLGEVARVLERDPSNRVAIVAAGEIHDGRSEYDQARDWYRRLMAIDSSNPTAFASFSAASLNLVSGAVIDAQARAGLLPPAPLGRRSAQREGGIAKDDIRLTLAERWSTTIAEGIDAGTRAAAMDPENAGVMLTLSAWHKLTADLSASPDEYHRNMTSADDWRHKAHDVRRVRAERGAR